MIKCNTKDLLDLEKTIARDVFDGAEFPWEVLPKIKDFVVKLGESLDPEKFDNPQENVWIAKSAKVFPSAYIAGPCIIDENAEVRHCAFIRGSAIVGKNAVVGNSVELKNCILFDNVQVPHYNYVGDSVLGYKAHLGAGTLTSNVKSDKTNVVVKHAATKTAMETGLRKFGAIVGDNTEVGCNTVLCPGTVLGRECIVYPVSRVRGFVDSRRIFKDAEHIIERK
ncbi:MAG: UDP-N-acetylglucosamine pyrophosphorylase [Clostridia bacterium]|nr:UDP-N-acetylglucosamine pyrophosphorylase [Clostridia bacterium]